MTYCIGWKNRDSVFLMADSASTSSAAPSTEQSSVGERHEMQPRGFVEESLLKLIRLSDAVIGAYSGSVSMAGSVIGVLKDRLQNQNPEDALRSAVASCGPFSDENKIGLLLGFMRDGKPQLLSFKHDGRQQIANHDLVIDMGSLTTPYTDISRAFCSQFSRRNLPSDRMLETCASILQSFSIRDLLMRRHVGGVFFGLRVDGRSVQWQSDTSYVFYSPSPNGIANTDFITVVERDCGVAVKSSITNDTRVFLNTSNTGNPRVWLQHWETPLRSFFDSGDSKFYIFLNKADRLITVVKMNSDLHNRYFHVNALGGGNFGFDISPEFISRLNAPVETPGATDQVSVGFRLHFLDVHNPAI